MHILELVQGAHRKRIVFCIILYASLRFFASVWYCDILVLYDIDCIKYRVRLHVTTSVKRYAHYEYRYVPGTVLHKIIYAYSSIAFQIHSCSNGFQSHACIPSLTFITY